MLQPITTTSVPRPIELESANDAFAVSHISFLNIGISNFQWQSVATTKHLKEKGHYSKEMMGKLAKSIQRVMKVYRETMEK